MTRDRAQHLVVGDNVTVDGIRTRVTNVRVNTHPALPPIEVQTEITDDRWLTPEDFE